MCTLMLSSLVFWLALAHKSLILLDPVTSEGPLLQVQTRRSTFLGPDAEVNRHIGELARLQPMQTLQYRGRIQVGNPLVELMVIFDTGSCNLLLLDCVENCPDSRYSVENSHSEVELNVPLFVGFGTGRVKGREALERVKILGHEMVDQIVGIVNEVRGSRRLYDELQGILGFNFPAMSMSKERSSAVVTLMKEVPSRMFSFYLSDTGSSAFYLGDGTNDLPELHSPDTHRYDIIGVPQYWEIELRGVYVGDTKLCCDDQKGSVILDSGSNFNSFPRAEHTRYLGGLTSEKVRYVLPDGFEIVVSPEDYLLPPKENAKRKSAFMPLDPVGAHGAKAYVFGSKLFFTKFFVNFHMGDSPFVEFSASLHNAQVESFLKKHSV
ncbi:MAG: uncharacterized protein KVP18_003751 [Porospora cf. gigantea A]|uniref:uncharacterized protein n=1 Tax=Porospora cf. gigantea A TaxID=2853593 RepID=UPI00355A62AA|nr:MAG: hypothetical protein KVP18_003751 [Porospora cf. gigantea A]